MGSLHFIHRKITDVIRSDLVAVFIAVVVLCAQTVLIFSLHGVGRKELIGANFFVFVPVYMAAFIIVRKHTVCYGIASVIQFFLYYINLYVYESRGTPVQFSDIYSVSDALSVAGNYPLVFNVDVFSILMYIVFFNALIFLLFAKREYKRFSEYKRCGVIYPVMWLVCSAVIVVIAVLPLEAPQFSLSDYIKENGFPLALISEYRNSRVKPPQGYSKEAAENILSEYDNGSSEDYEPINIIVIMNESFTDYSLFGETGFSEDPLPYYHSLEKNCVKGGLLVSVLGGNTCNTEFEFLTGASLAFLPYGSLPYNQYMNKEIYSLCKDEALSGYTKTAVHPYFAVEWRRDVNYSILGFDDFVSGEDFSESYAKESVGDITHIGERFSNFGSDLEYIRGFISDKECYRKALEIQDESNKNGKPSFIFAVTMQNHGSYNYKDFETVRYTNDSVLDQYLTLTSISDSALKYLFDELSEREEKTMVLMFGDHQPGSGYMDASAAGLYGVDQYITPYIIWTNYDARLEAPSLTSSNFLSLYLKSNAGMPLTKWDKIRLKLTESYPAVSYEYAFSSEGGSAKSMPLLIEEDIFREYRFVQHKMMFDN